MIYANFSGGKTEVTTSELYQYDIGQKLCIKGVDGLNDNTEVHFANGRMESAIVKNGKTTDEGFVIEIPNKFLEYGNVSPAKVWLYLVDSSTVGYTVKTIYVPIVPRKKPEGFISPSDPDTKSLLEEAKELLDNYDNDLNKVPFRTITSDEIDTIINNIP